MFFVLRDLSNMIILYTLYVVSICFTRLLVGLCQSPAILGQVTRVQFTTD